MTDQMPRFEKNGICNQLHRASIFSNIAKDSAKTTDANFSRFLFTSLGSAYGVGFLLLISKIILYINEEQYMDFVNQKIVIQRQLASLIRL